MFNDKYDNNDVYDFTVNCIENGCEYDKFANIVEYSKNDQYIVIEKDGKKYKITVELI